MSIGLQMKYLWHDVDVFKLEIAASNRKFSGVAECYVSIGNLAEAAEQLKGFPCDPSDIRELKFGEFGREFAGGCSLVRFFCRDSAGHAVVEVQIESERMREMGSIWNCPEQTAHFFAEIEARAVDDFVDELRQLEEIKGGAASLRFANSPAL
jgi:hypothetical protein